jgi:hypothetical protein
MWTCGCCDAPTEDAWYSSLHGMVCAHCHDVERRTVVSLHGRVRLRRSRDKAAQGAARHAGTRQSRVSAQPSHQLSA